MPRLGCQPVLTARLPGQLQLKFKDITLGTVKSLDFTPDHRKVLVTVATNNKAASFLTDTTQFWVVKPRLFAGNISGFDTLLSGSYIGMLPADTPGKTERNFVGNENPPVLDSDEPGTTFLLKTAELGSVNLGSPIFYRGLSVGQVLGWGLGDLAQTVTIHAFVRAPFDSYIHDQTRFWNASGLSVKMGGAGIDVQVESMRALLLGGIAFETPATGPASPVSQANHEFPLFANQDAARASSYSRKIPLVVYFDSSVRGLGVGSDVVMHGLKVGAVTDVRLTFDPAKDTIVAPIHLEIEPERIVGVGRQVMPSARDVVDTLVKKGLRATMVTGNLLTGELLISLDFLPNAPPATVTMQDGAFVFPTSSSGGLSDLQASAGELLRNVNAIPFASIGKNLDTIIANVSGLTNGPQLKETLTAVAGTMTDAQSLVKKVDADIGPFLKQLPEIAGTLETTLKQSNTLIRSVNNGYGDETQFHRDLDRLMTQLNDAVRSFRALADLLTRHPEALVRGRTDQGTP